VWEPTGDRPDPVEVLVESNRVRDQELVPYRYGRMAASPFAFLRGSALLMALDLASGPRTPLTVQLCGDAHLANFGLFASPERRMIFDLNDFDETWPGPFEWDVKRLGASIAVAGRDNGYPVEAIRRSVTGAMRSYATWLDRFAQMSQLETWYAKVEADQIVPFLRSSQRRRAKQRLRKAEARTSMKALESLTTVVDGRRVLVEDPPLVQRFGGDEVLHVVAQALADYRESLATDRRALFDRYHLVDVARKAVGVGSVGTRCWVVLLEGSNGAPLFLQVKEALPPAPQVALGDAPAEHQGRRVVEGQRLLQATSDILLGWTSGSVRGLEYYVRQLWDGKGSIQIGGLTPHDMNIYARVCGGVLARAHSRSGDAAALSGYVGTGSTFAEAVADWSEAYADQTLRDHAALVAAIECGSLTAA
jgi:uncharacterized protein (DUF2252 family)